MQFKKATLDGLNLRICVIGGTGDGKSTSALRIAKGLAGDSTPYVIDTDGGRASLNSGEFDFNVLELEPPYSGDRIIEAIQAAIDDGARVVVVDDASVEHQQMLEDHDTQARKLAEQYRSDPEKMSMSAWKAAKEPRKRLAMYLRSAPVHVIFTMRSERKINATTKKFSTELEGFIELPRMAHLSLVLTKNGGGKANPNPDGNLGEFAKCHKLIAHAVDYDEQIGEAVGQALCRAVGDASKPSDEERVFACTTIDELNALWKSLPKGRKSQKLINIFKNQKALIANAKETNQEDGPDQEERSEGQAQ